MFCPTTSLDSKHVNQGTRRNQMWLLIPLLGGKKKSNENFNYFKYFANVKLISWKLLKNDQEQFFT